MTRYPTVEEAIAVHAKLIVRFGGSDDIRDRAALESALARPRTGYYSDLIQGAAALWESLSQNHAFVDGNKRVAVTMTAAFLLGLYETGRKRFEELDRWLRQHAVAANPSA